MAADVDRLDPTGLVGQGPAGTTTSNFVVERDDPELAELPAPYTDELAQESRLLADMPGEAEAGFAGGVTKSRTTRR